MTSVSALAERLIGLANKATPGPWVVHNTSRCELGIRAPNEMNVKGAVGQIVRHAGIGLPSGKGRDNALFIAACDPDTIRSLCTALRTAREDERKRCAAMCEALAKHNATKVEALRLGALRHCFEGGRNAAEELAKGIRALK